MRPFPSGSARKPPPLSPTVASTGSSGPTCGSSTNFQTNATATLDSFPTSWATGVLPWSLTGASGGENRTYRLTYTVDPNAPVSTKGGTVTVTFRWEAQTR